MSSSTLSVNPAYDTNDNPHVKVAASRERIMDMQMYTVSFSLLYLLVIVLPTPTVQWSAVSVNLFVGLSACQRCKSKTARAINIHSR